MCPYAYCSQTARASALGALHHELHHAHLTPTRFRTAVHAASRGSCKTSALGALHHELNHARLATWLRVGVHHARVLQHAVQHHALAAAAAVANAAVAALATKAAATATVSRLLLLTLLLLQVLLLLTLLLHGAGRVLLVMVFRVRGVLARSGGSSSSSRHGVVLCVGYWKGCTARMVVKRVCGAFARVPGGGRHPRVPA